MIFYAEDEVAMGLDTEKRSKGVLTWIEKKKVDLHQWTSDS